MANVDKKLANFNQRVDEASHLMMNSVWPKLNETMINFSENVNKVSHVLKEKVWLTINETMSSIARLFDVNYRPSGSTTPNNIPAIRFSALCLALFVTLYAAYQTKHLLSPGSNGTNTANTA